MKYHKVNSSSMPVTAELCSGYRRVQWGILTGLMDVITII
jgi:hypothetical protein